MTTEHHDRFIVNTDTPRTNHPRMSPTEAVKEWKDISANLGAFNAQKFQSALVEFLNGNDWERLNSRDVTGARRMLRDFVTFYKADNSGT